MDQVRNFDTQTNTLATKSRLLSLPAEIREIIWKHVLIQPIQPVYLNHTRHYEEEDPDRQPYLAILQTCRTISTEATPIFYHHNHLVITARLHYQDWISSKMIPTPIENFSYYHHEQHLWNTCGGAEAPLELRTDPATGFLKYLLETLSPARCASIRTLTIKLKQYKGGRHGERCEVPETANAAYEMLARKCSRLRGLTLILLDNEEDYGCGPPLRSGLMRIRGVEDARIRWGFECPRAGCDHSSGHEVEGRVADGLRSAWRLPR